MKVDVRGSGNEQKGSVDLPSQFTEPVREDLILRGFLAVRSHLRQPYGAKKGAGMRPSANVSRRRRKYRGSYGFGVSRVPRKVMSRRGTRMNWVGAIMPGTVGGRRAHPPKATKKWAQKINIKERRKATRSAMAASMNKEMVAAKGHRVPEGFPFALDNSFEELAKTKDLVNAFGKLGLSNELTRSAIKNVRAGRGKSRGRKYKRRRGPLVVVSKKCKLSNLGNVPGLDVITVENLNPYVLAPGGHPGRLTLYTQKALETLKEKNLFN